MRWKSLLLYSKKSRILLFFFSFEDVSQFDSTLPKPIEKEKRASKHAIPETLVLFLFPNLPLA